MDELLPALLETRLRQRLGESDRAAFDAVVREHHLRVFRQLFALTGGDNARAADLAQETFIAAWQSLPTFSGRSGIGTWLHTIAVRAWFRAEQKAKSGASEVPLADALAELLTSPDADPQTGAATASALVTLYSAVNALPPAYRRAVLAFYREEKRYTEIADGENIAVGTVKSRLSTGIKLLRARLTHRKEELL
ncbi:MAG: RNA polymerase sigma factor [Armatimonadetes bacterium]|nr:RNA polymerase sigma factor [Armatimonadota bacterium]